MSKAEDQDQDHETEGRRVGCRSTGEVAQKLKQLLFRHRKHAIERALYREPETCLHNRPTRLQDDSDLVLPRICGHPGQLGMVCDLDYEGEAQAQGCPLWQPIKTVEQLKADFRNLVAAGPAATSRHYPDAAALMWVLGEGVENDLDGPDTEEVARDEPGKTGLGGGILRLLGRRT